MEKFSQVITNGWLPQDIATHEVSPHFDERDSNEISLLVIHNISLPPNQFGGPYITDLFLGKLDPNVDQYFEDIYQLKVSAHCLVRRDGSIVQYVPFDKRAWHAGISNFNGREKCNEFSIGIELEGSDDIAYTKEQYQQLALITQLIKATYPHIANNIVGHCDIAPGRKTDPGDSFEWSYFYSVICKSEDKK